MTTLEPLQQSDFPEMESDPTCCAAASPASHSVMLRTVKKRQKVYGQKCYGSWTPLDRASLLEKTYRNFPFLGQPETWKDSVTDAMLNALELLTRGLTIKEIAGGLLHTPTTMANFRAPSMQKHPNCRRYAKIFGEQKILPEHFEFLPIGWTALKPWKREQENAPGEADSKHEE